jgi:hypothetical protein
VGLPRLELRRRPPIERSACEVELRREMRVSMNHHDGAL